MSAVQPHHQQWFDHCTQLFSHRRAVSADNRVKLDLAALQSHSKVSTLYEKSAKRFGIQSSPLFAMPCGYHRSTPNRLLETVQRVAAEKLGLEQEAFQLVNSPLICENLQRELEGDKTYTRIASEEDFIKACEKLHEPNPLSSSFHYAAIFDFTPHMEKNQIDPKRFQEQVVKKFTPLFKAQFSDQSEEDLNWDLRPIFFGVSKEDNFFLLTASNPFSGEDSIPKNFLEPVTDIMRRAGFRLGPVQSKQALLKFCELEEVFEKENVPLPESSGPLPLASCRSLTDLLSEPDFIAFVNLAKSEQAPYLQIHPPAITALLQGLEEQQLDKLLSEKGLENLLHASYDKILFAVREAVRNKDDLAAFRNQIEYIHQEIQTFLIFLEPYNEHGDFSKALLRNMSSLLPENIGEARAYLKPSAMRVFSSVLAGLERQKQSPKLNILVHKDCYYYEADKTLRNGKNQYNTTVMDSEHYKEGAIEKCFMGHESKPYDLLVMEYNHNVSEQRTRYQKEDIIGQIKELWEKGLLAEKCTVLIDTTICLERADEMKELFADALIKEMINKGELNIVIIRSAQKFDMLGVDNYYGGIAITVNNPDEFAPFNERMDDPQDQLKGVSYQGLTHLQTYASSSLDQYRKAVMDNTWKWHRNLPTKMAHSEGSTNPVQISTIHEPGPIFLDLKFPNSPAVKKVFFSALNRFAISHKLPIMPRPSFSFMYTTYIVVGSGKTRITPGLESDETLQKYKLFFEIVQNAIDESLKDTKEIKAYEKDFLAAEAISQLTFVH